MGLDIPSADGLVTRSLRVSRKDWEKWKDASKKVGVRTQTLIVTCCNAAADSILQKGEKK